MLSRTGAFPLSGGVAALTRGVGVGTARTGGIRAVRIRRSDQVRGQGPNGQVQARAPARCSAPHRGKSIVCLSCLLADRRQEAIPKLEALALATPQEAQVLFLLGKCYIRVDRRAEATTCFACARELEPKLEAAIRKVLDVTEGDDDDEDDDEDDGDEDDAM